MAAMIEIQNLSKSFGPIRAVDDVSFRVERGTVLGFLGPNGAGKSTTMRMLTGFLTPTSGSAALGGHDVQREPIAAKRVLGYLPEGAPLYGDMTPRAFLEFVAGVRGLRGEQARASIERAVGRTTLGGVLEQPIETLSKGFKRRVGLAQAILHDPPVLVLDEPTDGLDPNQKHEVRELIRSMAKDKAIVLSTHILEEVEAVCTRVIIIAAGKVRVDCTPDELAARSRYHNAVALSVPAADGERVQQSLGKLDGVAAVDRLPVNGALADGRELVRLLAIPRAGRSIVGPIGERAREERWPVSELSVEHGRLDEVFRELTTGAAS
jgi:ABC-2 type transport system ATP-binding protein